ncbi:MAG: lipid-A-disaccharide synthase N-terminal domain-containing protein [Candidatus Eisenbacteria bacterium]|uniref:Lipid-A-disaccharide synthase N-terminal domain-containing protein n=1 Tax=Eiseniibacteriota bacterium TaxID=2212470 RepID=A0A956LVR6_UNCEI|nr:lipid-A-disaccharide synthase N-terminal domain-containing protein [Candidatus Eisenbacteria bacterium]
MNGWFFIGLAGQGLFGSRFLVQWLVSERKKRSVIPLAFWYLSIAGSLVLLTYAIHRRDPVFIIGECGGVLIYLRNLVLLRRNPTELVSTGETSPA